MAVGIERLAAVALAGLLAAAPLASAQSQTPQRGGTVLLTLGGDPPTVNPSITTGVPDGIAGCIMYQGLTQELYTGEVEPLLAKSWTISPDGKTYNFDLVKANWHDGKPFTSADAAYSLVQVSAKYSPTFSTAGALIDKVETPAPDKLTIHLKEPYGPFLLSLACPVGGGILPKHIFEGTNPLQNPATMATATPIGTGAFKFQEWKRGDHLRFVRNSAYWEPGKPYLDEIVARIIPQPAARTQALLAGEIDFISFYFFPSSDEKVVSASPKLKMARSATPAAIDYLFLNMLRKPVDDKKVRQALLMATDRNYLVKTAWLGRGSPGTMPFTNKIEWAADKSIDYDKMYPFDLAKANAALDAAGFPRKAEGIRFQVHMPYASEEADYVQVAIALKSMWAAAGVEVLIEPTERATFLKRIYTDHDFDVTLNGYGSFNEPALGIARGFVTSGIGKPYANVSSYSNKAVDELFRKGESVTSPEERGVFYKQAQKILAEDLPVFTLREKALDDALSTKLHDYLVEAHFGSWRNAWISQ